MATEANLPLDGVTVVDFSTTLPGPYCSSLLLRMGARVFAMEPPGGDSLRLQPTTYAAVARGKESVVVDLKQEGDRELALALVEAADVVIEGWRPGVADRLGVSYQACKARNPAIVYCSLSGFGATGPLAGRAAHDMNFLAEVGATALARDVGLPLGDLASGMMGAVRILGSLLRARETGAGGFLDVSAAGAVWDWVEAIGGSEAQTFVEEVQAYPSYGRFFTADNRVLVLGVCTEDKLWSNMAEALGMTEWVDCAFEDRVARGDEIRRELTEVIAGRTLSDLEAALSATDTAWNVEKTPGSSTPITGRLRVDERPPPPLDGGRPAALALIESTRSTS